MRPDCPVGGAPAVRFTSPYAATDGEARPLRRHPPPDQRSCPETREAAKTFDALGFHSVWVCDHLYGVPAPQLPILEAWTELAAVAAR